MYGPNLVILLKKGDRLLLANKLLRQIPPQGHECYGEEPALVTPFRCRRQPVIAELGQTIRPEGLGTDQ